MTSKQGDKILWFQDGNYLPYWLMYLGRFHTEAPLHTTDHVSENNLIKRK